MNLEGSLDAFSLPDIFALLSMTKKTGGLHLRRDHAQGVVWFTTGSVTGGASDVSRQSLARRLAGSGQVTEDALKVAVDRVLSEDGIGVGRALQQAGAVDEGTLHDVVTEHLVDTVFDLLRWPDGEFAFAVDEPNPDDVGVSRQVDDVVAEARRRLEAWESVAATVPSPRVVLSLATNPDTDPQLTREEWALLSLVDGRRTVGDIVALCGRGDFVVVSALAELVARGLVRTDEGDGVAALVRRHTLLALLEGATVAEPDEPVTHDRFAEPEPITAEPEPFAAEPEPIAAEPEPFAGEPEPTAAEPTFVSDLASLEPEIPIQPAERDLVTPQRPEPLLPPRQPEHPDDSAPMAVVGGGAAAAPLTASYIDRDPSVNKSLLLRLIAGVRGL